MSLPSLTVLQECVYRPNRGQHAAAAAWFGTTAESARPHAEGVAYR